MAELFATTGESVAHIVQQGDAWNAEVTLKDSRAQCLALDPYRPSTLYVGTHGKGVWKSSDNGRTWQELSALRSIPSAPTWSFPPRPWTSHVRWIAPNPHEAALLIVGWSDV